MEELIIGDRVYLITRKYGVEKSNPVVGSKLECVGTINSTNGRTTLNIIVEWDNGTSNEYKNTDLIKEEEYLSKYRVGDKVKLLRVKDIKLSKSNPIIGTRYECEGEIIEMGNSPSAIIKVAWDNGTENIYLEEHLLRIEMKSDIQTENINSIW